MSVALDSRPSCCSSATACPDGEMYIYVNKSINLARSIVYMATRSTGTHDQSSVILHTPVALAHTSIGPRYGTLRDCMTKFGVVEANVTGELGP